MRQTKACSWLLRTILARAAAALLLAGLVTATPLFAYYLYLIDSWSSYPERVGEVTPTKEKPMLGLFPGIRLPPVRAAADAGLADEAEVVGVCVAGRARAYALQEMGYPPTRHVVNDVLSGCAVSVTYCDLRKCARVFTGEPIGEPLQMDAGGFMSEHGMLLKVHGVDYEQETGENVYPPTGDPFPYQNLPFERTTWGAWRKAHPDTDVYVGVPTPEETASNPPINPKG